MERGFKFGLLVEHFAYLSDSSSFVDGKDLQEKFVKLCQVLKDGKAK